MSGKVINLRTRRKQRERAERTAAATHAAVASGISKLERATTKAEQNRATRTHDGHRLEQDLPRDDD